MDGVVTVTNATGRLGAFVARCAHASLSSPVMEKAAICLLDALGLALAARNERTAVAARAAAAHTASAENAARIWADGARVGLADAVLANSIAVHAHFQDDTDHNSWSHPASLIVPVAVGLGESRGASLSLVLRALIAGYATMEWLGADEIVARALIARGLRTSPTFGTIGAASAAAVTLGFDATGAANAIGMATSITGGVLEPVRCGSDEWRLQNGHAARGGLTAALLAERGVLGAPDGLEGPKGFLRSLAGMSDAPARWKGDPDVNIMLSIMAKPWATLGDNMPAVAAAKLIHDAGVGATRIRRISITLWRAYAEYPGTAFKGPFERTVQTQASSAFAAAAMLAYGEFDYDIAVERRTDPQILRLVEVTEITPHDGHALDATVEVTLADGTMVRREARAAPQTLIFQDRKRAMEVFERRVAAAGRGAACRVADTIFVALEQNAPLGIRSVLDDLTKPQ